METRFSKFSWQPTGVFSTPTLTRSHTKRAFLQAKARRGRGSQGPVSDQLYSSVWQERKMRRRRQNILLISTCNFFSCCIVRLEIYSCGAKIFDSPSIAVALWCCLWVAVKQFCSSLYISSTSFWNGDDEFFWPHFTYRVPFNEYLSLHQQSWKLFSFITDLQFESRVSLPHYKFYVTLLW